MQVGEIVALPLYYIASLPNAEQALEYVELDDPNAEELLLEIVGFTQDGHYAIFVIETTLYPIEFRISVGDIVYCPVYEEWTVVARPFWNKL